MEMTGTDANQLLPDLDRLRARVRADQRVTSAPMLAFGALILAYAVIVGLGAGHLRAAGRHSTLLLYWPLATAVCLVSLRWSERRRAVQDGVGEGRRTYRSATRAYLVGLALSAVLFIPALFIVLFLGVFTPMVWPAAVFLRNVGVHGVLKIPAVELLDHAAHIVGAPGHQLVVHMHADGLQAAGLHHGPQLIEARPRRFDLRISDGVDRVQGLGRLSRKDVAHGIELEPNGLDPGRTGASGKGRQRGGLQEFASGCHRLLILRALDPFVGAAVPLC